MARTVTMHGDPLELVGKELAIGEKIPDCLLVNKELKPVKLSDFAGKICIISCVPSLDTSVCDMMTRRFNSEAIKLSDNVVVLAISMDLPFGQDRWCIAADVANVHMLSDHREADFGKSFGVLISDLRLLARGVFVVDKDQILRYAELVPELTNEPDYEAVLSAVKELV